MFFSSSVVLSRIFSLVIDFYFLSAFLCNGNAQSKKLGGNIFYKFILMPLALKSISD